MVLLFGIRFDIVLRFLVRNVARHGGKWQCEVSCQTCAYRNQAQTAEKEESSRRVRSERMQTYTNHSPGMHFHRPTPLVEGAVRMGDRSARFWIYATQTGEERLEIRAWVFLSSSTKLQQAIEAAEARFRLPFRRLSWREKHASSGRG